MSRLLGAQFYIAADGAVGSEWAERQHHGFYQTHAYILTLNDNGIMIGRRGCRCNSIKWGKMVGRDGFRAEWRLEGGLRSVPAFRGGVREAWKMAK